MSTFVQMAGALVVLGSAMVTGLKVHILAIQHAPGLAVLLHRDAGVIAGLIVGAISWSWWQG